MSVGCGTVAVIHVSNITCSSSGGAAQTAFGILRAYDVSWLWHCCSETARNIPNAVCEAPPEDEQVMLETCRGPWFSVNLMQSASRWFHYTDVLSAKHQVWFDVWNNVWGEGCYEWVIGRAVNSSSGRAHSLTHCRIICLESRVISACPNVGQIGVMEPSTCRWRNRSPVNL
jgi:hypothetical protein